MKAARVVDVLEAMLRGALDALDGGDLGVSQTRRPSTMCSTGRVVGRHSFKRPRLTR
jgi:hypothetical protein